jgi:RNA polymerase sigma factor (TIGR02999 family)
MDDRGRDDVTQLLRAWNLGKDSALDDLVPVVYGELRRLAHHYMFHERPGHLLETTALINEAFIRLLDLQKVDWKNRDQFFAASAQLMRRILVDFARQRDAQKRGGDVARVTLSSRVLGSPGLDLDILALDESLTALSQLDRRKAQVVELRFFGGLTVEESASVLQVSAETVQRDWKFSKAWLFDRLWPQESQ